MKSNSAVTVVFTSTTITGTVLNKTNIPAPVLAGGSVPVSELEDPVLMPVSELEDPVLVPVSELEDPVLVPVSELEDPVPGLIGSFSKIV